MESKDGEKEAAEVHIWSVLVFIFASLEKLFLAS